MIASFGDKETEKIWNQEFSKKLPPDIQKTALRKLILLHRSDDLRDLKIPGSNNLEALKGKRKGQHSIRINKQWRICFRFKDRQAFEVEITDYH